MQQTWLCYCLSIAQEAHISKAPHVNLIAHVSVFYDVRSYVIQCLGTQPKHEAHKSMASLSLSVSHPQPGMPSNFMFKTLAFLKAHQISEAVQMS